VSIEATHPAPIRISGCRPPTGTQMTCRPRTPRRTISRVAAIETPAFSDGTAMLALSPMRSISLMMSTCTTMLLVQNDVAGIKYDDMSPDGYADYTPHAAHTLYNV